jgi:ankyrin repeat protein
MENAQPHCLKCGSTKLIREEPTHRLWVAVKEGDLNAIEAALKAGADIFSREAQGGATLLHEVELLDVAQRLIELGLDVNAVANIKNTAGYGQTPLHFQALRRRKEDRRVAKLLIDKGANIAARDPNGCTPLHKAAEWGNDNLVRLLVEHGADVNSTDDGGNSPLHLAANHGRLDTVKLLLSLGAILSPLNKAGRTPCDEAQAGKIQRKKAFMGIYCGGEGHAAIIQLLSLDQGSALQD